MDQDDHVKKTIENINNGSIELKQALDSLNDNNSKLLLYQELLNSGILELKNKDVSEIPNVFDVKSYTTLSLPAADTLILNTDYTYNELMSNIQYENFEEALNILESFDRENSPSGITRQTPFEISKISIDNLNKYFNILLTYSLGKDYKIDMDTNLSTRGHAIVFLSLKFILYQDIEFKRKWGSFFENYFTNDSSDLYTCIFTSISSTIFDFLSKSPGIVDVVESTTEQEQPTSVMPDEPTLDMPDESTPVTPQESTPVMPEQPIPVTPEESTPDMPKEDISSITKTSPDVTEEQTDTSSDIEEVDLDKMQ